MCPSEALYAVLILQLKPAHLVWYGVAYEELIPLFMIIAVKQTGEWYRPLKHHTAHSTDTAPVFTTMVEQGGWPPHSAQH